MVLRRRAPILALAAGAWAQGGPNPRRGILGRAVLIGLSAYPFRRVPAHHGLPGPQILLPSSTAGRAVLVYPQLDALTFWDVPA